MPSFKLAPNQTVPKMWSKPFFCAIAVDNRDPRLKRKAIEVCSDDEFEAFTIDEKAMDMSR